MNRFAPIISAVILAVLIGGAWWYFSHGGTLPKANDIGAIHPSAISAGGAYAGAPLTKSYLNQKFSFSVQMPDDFTAAELPPDENGATAIVLQNTKGDGIQILITPDSSNATSLSAEDVAASIPDLKVLEPEKVQIGAGNTGVAFKSDNEAFNKESREVWFYFRGNLYQISTYARLDGLLKAMFATWKFF